MHMRLIEVNTIPRNFPRPRSRWHDAAFHDMSRHVVSRRDMSSVFGKTTCRHVFCVLKTCLTRQKTCHMTSCVATLRRRDATRRSQCREYPFAFIDPISFRNMLTYSPSLSSFHLPLISFIAHTDIIGVLRDFEVHHACDS